MPTVHDAALEWANANPTDPRAKDVQAKAWASQNPGDPRSKVILDSISSRSKSKETPFNTANNIESKQDSKEQSETVLSRLQNPERWKAILGMDSKYKQEYVGGTPPMVIPAGSIPALAGLAGKLGSNVLSRLGTASGAGAIQGATQDPKEGETRTDNAMTGALVGFGAQGLGEAANAIKGAGQAVYRAFKPGSFETNSANLGELLKGKTVEVNPRDYLGKDPSGATDKIIQDAISAKVGTGPEAFKATAGNIPDSVSIPAEDLNTMRQSLHKAVEYKQVPTARGMKTTAANPELQATAAKATSLQHSLSPDIDKELSNTSSALGANASIQNTMKSLGNGDLVQATKGIPVVPAEAIKGAGRSLVKPADTLNSPSLSILLNQIMQREQK